MVKLDEWKSSEKYGNRSPQTCCDGNFMSHGFLFLRWILLFSNCVTLCDPVVFTPLSWHIIDGIDPEFYCMEKSLCSFGSYPKGLHGQELVTDDGWWHSITHHQPPLTYLILRTDWVTTLFFSVFLSNSQQLHEDHPCQHVRTILCKDYAVLHFPFENKCVLHSLCNAFPRKMVILMITSYMRASLMAGPDTNHIGLQMFRNCF